MAKKKVVKRGPLSDKEKKYIEKHKEKDIEWLLKKVNKSPNVVTKYHHEINNPVIVIPYVKEKVTEIKNKNNVTQEIKAGDLFARNERWGVTIMTEAAAMRSDETRAKKVNIRANNCIQKIKRDE